jgi:N-acetylglutamate synthase-like GNAT family acetyltransferase
VANQRLLATNVDVSVNKSEFDNRYDCRWPMASCLAMEVIFTICTNRMVLPQKTYQIMLKITIRHTRVHDIPALVKLQKKSYPPDMPPWSKTKFEHQIEVFPQGQIVAERDGSIVGCASSLIVAWDDWCDAHTWREITASGTFNNHNPEGRTLYGAEVFVDPDIRGEGLGHALYEGRRKLCRAMNLKRIIACGRLPGYHMHAAKMGAEDYAKRVVWGDFYDPVLGFQLHEGFDYCGVIEGYLPEDRESGGNASLIVWRNVGYDPSKPTYIPEEGIL